MAWFAFYLLSGNTKLLTCSQATTVATNADVGLRNHDSDVSAWMQRLQAVDFLCLCDVQNFSAVVLFPRSKFKDIHLQMRYDTGNDWYMTLTGKNYETRYTSHSRRL